MCGYFEVVVGVLCVCDLVGVLDVYVLDVVFEDGDVEDVGGDVEVCYCYVE